MAKWLILALGVFLFVNGMFTRTYGYSDPERYCFQMDLIDLVGCFANPALPTAIMWAAIVMGAALILGCVLLARAERARGGTKA